jgi:hypothetical protein
MINIEINYKKSEYLIAYSIFIILGLNYFLLNLMHVDRDIVEINRYICLIIIILTSIFKKIKLNIFLFLLLFGITSNGNSLLMGFYFSIVISLIFYNISSTSLLKIQLRCLNFIFLIWVFLLISGMYTNQSSLDYYAAEINEINQERLRYSLGFGNPNEAASIVTSFVLMGFVASSNRIIPFIFYLVTSLIVYFYTDSRALILAAIFFILFKCIYNLIYKKFYA